MSNNTIVATQMAGTTFQPEGLCQLLMYKMRSVVRCGYLYYIKHVTSVWFNMKNRLDGVVQKWKKTVAIASGRVAAMCLTGML